MALVHITLSRVDDRGDTGGSLPIVTSVPELAETITSSGTSQVSTIAADKADRRVWTITAGGNVWVRFAETPVAASGVGQLVLAGQSRDFSVTAAGEKVAVKDA